MKKSMMRNSILFYSLTAISFSAFGGSLRSQEFEAYIQSKDVNLLGGQAIVLCHAFQPFSNKMIDYKATGAITVEPASGNYYKLHVNKVEALKYKGYANVCTMGIELRGVDVTGKHISGFYSLDGFETLDKAREQVRKDIKKLRREADRNTKEEVELANADFYLGSFLDCSSGLYTTEKGRSECTLKSPEGADYYQKFYSNVQKDLSSLVLKSQEDKIFFGVAASYPKTVYKTMRSLDKDFEVYWRKRRLGFDTKDVITVEKPSSSGSIAGMILGGMITGSLEGLAAGGVLGSLLDNRHAPEVTTTKVPLPIPFVDSNKILISAKNGFASKNDMLISLSLLDVYQKFLYQNRALSEAEIQELKALKKLYSPNLDKIFTKIMETDYQNQGICVRDGDCHLK